MLWLESNLSSRSRFSKTCCAFEAFWIHIQKIVSRKIRVHTFCSGFILYYTYIHTIYMYIHVHTRIEGARVVCCATQRRVMICIPQSALLHRTFRFIQCKPEMQIWNRVKCCFSASWLDVSYGVCKKMKSCIVSENCTSDRRQGLAWLRAHYLSRLVLAWRIIMKCEI